MSFITAVLLVGLTLPSDTARLKADTTYDTVRLDADPAYMLIAAIDAMPAVPDLQEPQAEARSEPQEPKPTSEEKKPATPPHTGIRALLDGLKEDVQHLPSRPNLYLTAIGGGLAAAVHPADQDFNVRLRSHYT